MDTKVVGQHTRNSDIAEVLLLSKQSETYFIFASLNNNMDVAQLI